MIYFEPSLEEHISKYLYIFKPEEIHFGLEYIELSHPKAVWVLPNNSEYCDTIKDLGEELLTVGFDENNKLLVNDLHKILNLKSITLKNNSISFEDIMQKQNDVSEGQVITQIDGVQKKLYEGYISLNNVTVLARAGIPSIDLAKFACKQVARKKTKWCVIDLDILPTFGAKYSGDVIDEVGSMANAKEFSDITPIPLDENVVYLFGTMDSTKMEGLLQENWENLLSSLEISCKISDYNILVLMNLESMFTNIYRAFTRNNKGYVLLSNLNYIKEVAMKISSTSENTTLLVDYPAEKLTTFQSSLKLKMQPLKDKGKYVSIIQ